MRKQKKTGIELWAIFIFIYLSFFFFVGVLAFYQATRDENEKYFGICFGFFLFLFLVVLFISLYACLSVILDYATGISVSAVSERPPPLFRLVPIMPFGFYAALVWGAI